MPCLTSQQLTVHFQADWAEIAKTAEFNTPKQAKNMWWVIKKKLLGDAANKSANAEGGDDGAQAKAGSGKKRKKDGEWRGTCTI